MLLTHAEISGEEVVGIGVERTVLLHGLEELDDDLGAGADQDLTLASLLGVVDAVEGIVKDGGADHLGGLEEILKSKREVRYLPGDRGLAFRGLLSMEECPPASRIEEGSAAQMSKGRTVSRADIEFAFVGQKALRQFRRPP